MILTSLIFFLFSFGIAVISVMAGIGGGVLFTPIMLAFTNIDSLVVRSTGLIVAMFSGLISSGPLMKSGMANLKITIALALSFSIGALLGANTAIFASQYLGEFGDLLIRLLLAVLVAGIAVYFLFGGKKVEWPEKRGECKIARYLDLHLPYHEKSTGHLVEYGISNTAIGIFLIFFVGFISGLFGLGGGWAIAPIQNLVMGLPLKVAAANSGVLIGMGDCIAIWQYFNQGAIIPVFVAPWLAGQVFGGIVGAKFLSNVKISSVRYILIAIMIFTSFSLFASSFVRLGIIPKLSWIIYFGAFVLCSIFAFVAIRKAEKSSTENSCKRIDFSSESPDWLAIPKAQILYGQVVYWLTLVSAIIVVIGMTVSFIFAYNETNELFYAVLSGNVAVKGSDAVHSHYGIGQIFNISSALNIILLGVVIGISSAGIALAFSAWNYISQKNWFFACSSIFLIGLMILSVSGILKIK